MKLFTIYDSVANAFIPPFHHPDTGGALRAFTEAVNSTESNISKAPADYILYELGI